MFCLQTKHKKMCFAEVSLFIWLWNKWMTVIVALYIFLWEKNPFPTVNTWRGSESHQVAHFLVSVAENFCLATGDAYILLADYQKILYLCLRPSIIILLYISQSVCFYVHTWALSVSCLSDFLMSVAQQISQCFENSTAHFWKPPPGDINTMKCLSLI